MKTKYYVDGKKITKKALTSRVGSKELVKRMTQRALSDHEVDPDDQGSYIIGCGDAAVVTIKFEP